MELPGASFGSSPAAASAASPHLPVSLPSHVPAAVLPGQALGAAARNDAVVVVVTQGKTTRSADGFRLLAKTIENPENE